MQYKIIYFYTTPKQKFHVFKLLTLNNTNKLDGELFLFIKILQLYRNEKSVFLDKTACIFGTTILPVFIDKTACIFGTTIIPVFIDKTACIFGTTIVPVNKTMPCNTEIQRSDFINVFYILVMS